MLALALPLWWYDFYFDHLIESVIAGVVIGVVLMLVTSRMQRQSHCARCCDEHHGRVKKR